MLQLANTLIGVGINVAGTHYIAGGGGGGAGYTGGLRGEAGFGGGGFGADPSTPASNGDAKTGGGGGGGVNGRLSGAGGSGVVVIRYLQDYGQATTTGSATTGSVDGYHYHIFTGSGTVTF